jgi:preprotein translocase SecF subunit
MIQKIDFIKKAKYFIAVSVILLLAGLVSLILNKGFKLGIDFAGGTAFNVFFPAQTDVNSEKIKQIMQKHKISGEVTTSRGMGTDKRTSFYITINEENKIDFKNTKVLPSDILLLDLYMQYEKIGVEPFFDQNNSIIVLSKNSLLTIDKLIETLTPSADERRRMDEISRSESEAARQTARRPVMEASTKTPTGVNETSLKKFSSRLGSGRIFALSDNSGFKVQIDIPVGTLDAEKADIQTRFKNFLFERISASDVTKVTIEGRQFIGPKIGAYFIRVSIEVIILVSVLILIYVAIRFRFKFGLAAVIALIHDTFIMIGFVSILNLEMDITIVAAILTIIGYSINDTIVIFDRIRENTEKISTNKDEYFMIVNKSIWGSLSRTLITSLTTLLVVGVLLIWGGDAIYNFYLLLLIGIVIGTYSSIFIASPVLVYWERYVEKRDATKKAKKKKKATA